MLKREVGIMHREDETDPYEAPLPWEPSGDETSGNSFAMMLFSVENTICMMNHSLSKMHEGILKYGVDDKRYMFPYQSLVHDYASILSSYRDLYCYD